MGCSHGARNDGILPKWKDTQNENGLKMILKSLKLRKEKNENTLLKVKWHNILKYFLWFWMFCSCSLRIYYLFLVLSCFSRENFNLNLLSEDAPKLPDVNSKKFHIRLMTSEKWFDWESLFTGEQVSVIIVGKLAFFTSLVKFVFCIHLKYCICKIKCLLKMTTFQKSNLICL